MSFSTFYASFLPVRASLLPIANSNIWVIQLEMFQMEAEKDLNVQWRLQVDPLE